MPGDGAREDYDIAVEEARSGSSSTLKLSRGVPSDHDECELNDESIGDIATIDDSFEINDNNVSVVEDEVVESISTMAITTSTDSEPISDGN